MCQSGHVRMKTWALLWSCLLLPWCVQWRGRLPQIIRNIATQSNPVLSLIWMWCAIHHSQRGAPTSDTQVCTLLHPSPLDVASARTATASSLGAIRVKGARTLQATVLAPSVVVSKHLCRTSAFQFSCAVAVTTCFYSRGREIGIWGSNQWLWSPLFS